MLYNEDMGKLITISASKARSDFFNILAAVYMKNKGYLIKKSGIPVAKIVKIEEPVNKKEKVDLMSLAGAWKDIDTDSMIKYIYEGRKDKGKLKRKLPSFK